MPRVKRWSETPIVDGVGEVKLFSWKYFLTYMYQEMLDYRTYIWRGQRCENWLLESTFDRLVKKAKIRRREVRRFRNSHIDQFKYSVRGRRGSNPRLIEDENEWWALGQHHGLATPLLDWTMSPFVAAYFAFIGMGGNQTTYRTVYGLHRPGVQETVDDIYRDELRAKEEKKKAIAEGKKGVGLLKASILYDIPIKKQVEFIRPLSDENQRLVNQGGMFTRGPEGRDFESWIKSNCKNDTGYALIKIMIPNKDRAECLKTLNRMNINHSTLFPDLYGASRYCNLFAEIEKY